MKPYILLVFVFVKLIFAQNSREEAINSIFSRNSTFDFLADYEEVTPPPLKGIGALTKCGEGIQANQYVCVPYYNCNPDTKVVEEKSDLDGSNRIDIRMQDEEEPKCEHYLEICCKLPDGGTGTGTGTDNGNSGGDNNNNNNNNNTPSPPTRPTRPPTRPPVTPPSEDSGVTQGTPGTRPNGTRRANCGIRNSEGLDFNFIAGNNEANFGEFPWMVAILRKNPSPKENLSICGGSLIGPNVVLTGAHCVHNVDIRSINIRAGEWDTQTQNERLPYQERNVIQKIVHEHFIRGNLYNDVALLILDRPFTKTDNIGTVCLPEQSQNFNSRECFATGWGKDIFGQQGRYAVILKKLQLPLVQHDSCQTALRKTRLGSSFILHRSFICAGGEPNLDTCTGDGGSPLVCPDPNNPGRYLQMGIVAWGIGCGENQLPGVYVDVASFRNWIDLKVQELGIPIESYIL